MTSSSDDYSDLAQVLSSNSNIQNITRDVRNYFKIENITKKEGCSKVDCEWDESEILNSAREEFKKELGRSQQIIDVVKAIVPYPKRQTYLSYVVRLLVFQSGSSDLGELVGQKDASIIFIPVLVVGSGEATVEEKGTRRQTTVVFAVDSMFFINGRCSVYMQPGVKAICVVLSIGKG